MLGGKISQGSCERLWRWSGGNPLYLREIIRAGHDHGSLTQDGDEWVSSGPIPAHERLLEVVNDRIGDVPVEQSEVLEVLAIADPIDLPVLTAVTSVHAVEAAERSGLIVLDPVSDGRATTVTPFHPLYSEVARATLPTIRKRALQVALADAVAARNPSPIVICCVSLRGRLEAGVADAVLLLAAAKRAMSVADHPLAERLAVGAERAGAGPDATVLRADACYWQHRNVQRQTVCSLASCIDDDPQLLTSCGDDTLDRSLLGPSSRSRCPSTWLSQPSPRCGAMCCVTSSSPIAPLFVCSRGTWMRLASMPSTCSTMTRTRKYVATRSRRRSPHGVCKGRWCGPAPLRTRTWRLRSTATTRRRAGEYHDTASASLRSCAATSPVRPSWPDTAYGMAMAGSCRGLCGCLAAAPWPDQHVMRLLCSTAEERLREASDLLRRHDTVSFEAWALALLATVQRATW